MFQFWEIAIAPAIEAARPRRIASLDDREAGPNGEDGRRSVKP